MVTLPLTTWGSPEAPRRALLVHGLSSNAQTWWRVAETLADDGWFVTAPDLRGHGTAPRAESYAFADFAADLPAGSYDLLIAHSLGGAVAVSAVSRLASALAARLVLLDPVLEVPAHEWEAVRADQLEELELTIDGIRAAKPHWHPRDHELKVEAVGQADRAMVEAVFDDNPGWNIVAEAQALTVPTLMLGGDHAVYSMLATETADAVVAANPLVSYREIEGAGHSLHRDRPEETIAAIRAWAGA